jgi:DNA invertase Pin-like site-specific DNA recombinase
VTDRGCENVRGNPPSYNPLAERPEGKRLRETARSGDVIITARLDRAFRSAADALGTLEELKDQGVGLQPLAPALRPRLFCVPLGMQ